MSTTSSIHWKNNLTSAWTLSSSNELAFKPNTKQSDGESVNMIHIVCCHIIIRYYTIRNYRHPSSIDQSINLSIYQSINLSTYQSINLPIYLSTNLPIYLPTYLSIYLPIYLSNYLPIYLPTYLSIYPSIYPSIILLPSAHPNQTYPIKWITSSHPLSLT